VKLFLVLLLLQGSFFFKLATGTNGADVLPYRLIAIAGAIGLIAGVAMAVARREIRLWGLLPPFVIAALASNALNAAAKAWGATGYYGAGIVLGVAILVLCSRVLGRTSSRGAALSLSVFVLAYAFVGALAALADLRSQ
jgi:hypothetical protein